MILFAVDFFGYNLGIYFVLNFLFGVDRWELNFVFSYFLG